MNNRQNPQLALQTLCKPLTLIIMAILDPKSSVKVKKNQIKYIFFGKVSSYVINIRIYLNCLQFIPLLTLIAPGLCSKPKVVGGKVDMVDQDNQNGFGESAEVVLFKVTCFSDYQLIGSRFHLCENGD